MNIKAFFKFVEIQTKLASVLPYIFGILFAYYRYSEFNLINVIFMFISLVFFDMTTTAVNNYSDYKKALKKEGYNYENHNAIVKYKLSTKQALISIFFLFSVAVFSGLILFFLTDLFVLLIGVISFSVGIAYSWGPIPISRMPLGEIFSGLFMGFVIFLLSVYINIFHLDIISLNIIDFELNLILNIKEFLVLFFVSIPMIITIANIMLANNICDLKDDVINKRFTLPFYIGTKNSLKLFKTLYILLYINLFILIIMNIFPIAGLIIVLSIIPLTKNIKKFEKMQLKQETFVFSVKNHFIISILMIISVFLSILFNI